MYAAGSGVEVLCENCTFVSDSAGIAGAGAYVGFGADATIANCTFSENWCGSGYNGALEFSSPLTDGVVENTIVAFNDQCVGVHCEESAPPIVEFRCCDVYGNDAGDWTGLLVAEQWGINGNFWGDPGFCDRENGDFSIHSTSPCAPDEFLGCGLVGAHGIGGCAESEQLHIVTSGGSGDFLNIQAAVNDCANWDVIELRDAVFTGEGNRDISFPAGRAVTIRSEGGDPSTCLIHCEGCAPNYHRAFTFSSGNGQEIMLREIGITGGEADPEAEPPADKGGAINCAGGSPRIAGCLLYRNAAQAGGGAIYCAHEPGVALIRCTLSGNEASQGAGLCCGGAARPALEGSIVSFSPWGEAVYCDVTADAVLSGCVVHGNAAGDWVGCIEDQEEVRYNYDVDPCFCDEEHDDYALHSDSWCAVNECCGLIGAMPVGCAEGECPQPSPSAVPEQASTETPSLLLRAVPNPLVGTGLLTYSIAGLPAGAPVVLSVHDAAGRLVRALTEAPQTPGEHLAFWDGADRRGRVVGAGVYFYRLSAGGLETCRPVLVVR